MTIINRSRRFFQFLFRLNFACREKQTKPILVFFSLPFHISWFLLFSFFLFPGCSEEIPNLRELPPEVLPVVNELNENPVNFGVTALAVNNTGGITGKSGYDQPLQASYLSPNFGFYIRTDKTGYQRIRAANAYCIWPYDLSDQDLIVGAFLPDTAIRNPSSYRRIPCQAFLYDVRSDTWTPFRMEGKGYTALIQVNNQGLAWGYCGNSLSGFSDREYFLLHTGTGELIDFIPGENRHFTIHAINDKYLIVSYPAEGNFHPLLGKVMVYSLEDLSPIHEIPAHQLLPVETYFTGINSDGIVIGYQRFGSAYEYNGFAYRIQTGSFTKLEPSFRSGQWSYDYCKPLDINDQGWITGYAGRIRPRDPLYQYRAMILHADGIGFEDITPKNGEAYSETYSINNLKEVAGYGGFWKDGAVLNRAFLVKK